MKISHLVRKLETTEHLIKNFMEADYGAQEITGMVKFMMSEDWPRRMP